ncbi:YscO family type III secretion system apparatus protein, partial [Pseudomonas aeruginosa]|nr:YscO family type III secretion system apparatus protein [Pseudomonas aeruginosa]
SLAARVRGPAAIRRLLAHLHGARDLSEAKALQASLPEGDSIITQSGERLGQGWLRVSRSGAAAQGALLREREIQELREQIEQLQDREAELEEQLAGFREQLQAAEQQREDAQRALYQAHRAVSELAGQL